MGNASGIIVLRFSSLEILGVASSMSFILSIIEEALRYDQVQKVCLRVRIWLYSGRSRDTFAT